MTIELKHDGKVIQKTADTYQTKTRGDNNSEYQIYLACADDGRGMDITTGGKSPLKSFDEWLEA